MERRNETRRVGEKWGKTAVAVAISGTMLIHPLVAQTAVFADGAIATDEGDGAGAGTKSLASQSPLKLVDEQMVTSGAKRKTYQWAITRNGKVEETTINVVEVDLKNPYVKLDVMTGSGGQYTKLNSVKNMTKETGAVAGINGDYWATGQEGAPLGPQVTGGQFVSSTSQLSGMYAFAVTKSGVPMIDSFTFQGTVTASDGATYNLAGINKASYQIEPTKQYSHVDAIYIYTSAWGALDRPKDSGTTPTEVLVQNNVITQISVKAPISGPVLADGYILRTHGKAADFVVQHMKVGDPVTVDYKLQSNTDPSKQYGSDSFQTMIGGHTLLVDQGKAIAEFTRPANSIDAGSFRSRTGVGYSKDGRYAYLITAQDYGSSIGLSLREFQKVMTSIGVWKGLNLDGGGSTQMAVRPLGEFDTKLAHPTEYGTTQRKVVNGLGVFSTAPQGEVKGIAISGETMLFVGEQASYTMKAYDEYYNPVDGSSMPASWSGSGAIGKFENNTFTASKPGKAKLTVTSGKAKQSIDVEVVGRSMIDKMSIDTATPALTAGASYKLPVTISTKDGRVRSVPPQSVKWELRGFKGSVDGDTLNIQSVSDNTTLGYAIAHYDGFSAVLPLRAGTEKMWESFEKTTYPISFSGAPAETTGQAGLATGVTGAEKTTVLRLAYDFTQGTGTKAAYAAFNGSGIAIDGKPQAMKLDIFGDNSLNWLRAEVTDAGGKLVRIDLAKNVDWAGWKTVNVDLGPYNLAYPIKMKRLYIASIPEGQDERAAVGELYFDNIRLLYPNEPAKLVNTKVELTLGKKQVKVNGKAMTIDVAPAMIKDSTYVPIKFIVDAVGGQVQWDPKEKKVSILRGERLLDMWINQQDMILNGQSIVSEVTPIIKSNRTLVPLRLVSEKLGLTVAWDPKTKSITIQ